jgi:hypothetical protein
VNLIRKIKKCEMEIELENDYYSFEKELEESSEFDMIYDMYDLSLMNRIHKTKKRKDTLITFILNLFRNVKKEIRHETC